MYGQAAGCLGTAVLASALTVVLQPPRLSPAQAATIPTVFMTADACLNDAAQMRRGTRVLVHAATGTSHLSAAFHWNRGCVDVAWL